MKIKKLLKKVDALVEMTSESDARGRRDALKKSARKLRAKQKRLETKFAAADDEHKSKILKKLKMVKAHRKKALQILRQEA